MRTLLLSNIPHYHYLAEALWRGGHLERYITSVALGENESVPFWAPEGMRRKLEGRRLKNVPLARIRRIQWPEILQRGLPRLRLASQERANWLNNGLFDRAALRHLEECEVFHFVSSVGLRCAEKAKRSGAKIVCDVRQEHPNFQRKMFAVEESLRGTSIEVTGYTYESRVLEEFSLADYIVTPSLHAKRTFLEEGFAPERVWVLPYGVDLEHFPLPKPAGPSAQEVFRVIYAGQVTFRKGVLDLLEAFRRAKIPGAELILVGPVDPAIAPHLKPYEGLFQSTGPVAKVDLHRYYQSASVFVLPSLADSFSLATLEAMACGLPVIVSEHTGAADCLENGVSGFVEPVRNPDALAERLLWLARHPVERRSMGAAACAAARSMSWERYGENALRLYKERLQASEALAPAQAPSEASSLQEAS